MWMSELKDKVIDDFNKLVLRLQKGYKDDYSNILNMICLIEFGDYLDNTKSLYEYYINL